MIKQKREHKPLLHSIFRMPINTQGGKGCKKGKNSESNILMVECKENEGQMFGRVVKVEGDRRFRVFCNDSKERICKLAGRIRRGDRVERGGIVLISVRGITAARSNSTDAEIGDIIDNIDPGIYGKIKKLDGINPLLFTNIENEDKATLKRRVGLLEEGHVEVDDIFELGGEEEASAEGEAEAEAEEDEEAPTKEERARELVAKKKKEELERSAKRNVKYMENGDLDVDAI
jgi:initiation factor 1A